MAGFSTYLAGEILDDYFITGTAYVSLHDGDPGLNGANEATTDVAAARLAVSFGSIVSKGIANDADVEFGPSDSTVTITHFGLWDAASGGNFLGGDALDVTRNITASDPVTFLTGDLTVQL